MGSVSAKLFAELLERRPGLRPKVYIETGLNQGAGLLRAQPFFDQIHGIELSKSLYEISRQATDQYPNISVHLGDSRQLLAQVLSEVEGSCFFYHDAHFCHTSPPIKGVPFPLWDELEVVRARVGADIVAVDDVHCFGMSPRRDGRYAGWSGVTVKSLHRFFGAQLVDSLTANDVHVMYRDASAAG